VDIIFRTTRLLHECTDQRIAQKRYGYNQAKLLRRRLDELKAAETLAVVRALPQTRCHELTADRAGQLSVDLQHPYRLIFRPAHEPAPAKPDGGLDWTRVTAIEIIEVVDTHG
jgi:proteic killer suppression protein